MWRHSDTFVGELLFTVQRQWRSCNVCATSICYSQNIRMLTKQREWCNSIISRERKVNCMQLFHVISIFLLKNHVYTSQVVHLSPSKWQHTIQEGMTKKWQYWDLWLFIYSTKGDNEKDLTSRHSQNLWEPTKHCIQYEFPECYSNSRVAHSNSISSLQLYQTACFFEWTLQFVFNFLFLNIIPWRN